MSLSGIEVHWYITVSNIEVRLKRFQKMLSDKTPENRHRCLLTINANNCQYKSGTKPMFCLGDFFAINKNVCPRKSHRVKTSSSQKSHMIAVEFNQQKGYIYNLTREVVANKKCEINQTCLRRQQQAMCKRFVLTFQRLIQHNIFVTIFASLFNVKSFIIPAERRRKHDNKRHAIFRCQVSI